MYSLIRILYRSFFVNGKPLHQILIGIALIPVGGLISWASLFADPYHYYPYFVILGIVLAVFGVVLFIKGLIGLANGKPKSAPNAYGAYTGPAQYPQYQQPYPQQYPQYPQQPYAQPQDPQQPYEQVQYPQQ